MNLAYLQENFSVDAEGYEKVEQTLSVEQLAPLQATFCPLGQGAMLQAAFVIVRFYQELASLRDQIHWILYPANFARVISDWLEHRALCFVSDFIQHSSHRY